MSDDVKDRQLGLGIRFIRQWREPTPEERRADLAQFAEVLAAALEHRARLQLLALKVGRVQ